MEVWKDIPWYEWLYQVSNLGNIKSLNYKNSWIQKELKLNKDWRWYLFTKLYKNKVYKNIKAHKVVMLAFIWESNWLQVNHIDWVKLNNKIENLEYTTSSENVKHSYRLWLNKANKSALWKVGILNNLSKKVYRYDLDLQYIDEWFIYDYNINYWYDRTAIVKCCNWRLKTAYNFIWKYENNRTAT